MVSHNNMIPSVCSIIIMTAPDAYVILNLPPEPSSLTVEQVKYNYKLLARQLHPDKCGSRLSSEEATSAFQALTDAYRIVVGEIRAMEYASFDVMKKRAERAEPADAHKPQASKKKFSLHNFNSVFEKDRLLDPVGDAGYAEWMAKYDPDKGGVPEEELQRSRQMITYRAPEPVTITRKGNVQYTELGVDKIDDYSRTDAACHGIQYTDYRVAHTTTRLVNELEASNATKRRTFDSLEKLQQHRAGISYTMTDAELKEYTDGQLRIQEREHERGLSLKRREGLESDHYRRVHMTLTGSCDSSDIKHR